MTVVVDRRADFTLENFWRVTRGGESVRLGSVAEAAMVAARQAFVALVEADRSAFIYGVTVRPGAEVGRSLAAEEQRVWAAEGLRDLSPAFDGGGFLSERVVRGIVFARLANFVEGHAPVRPVVADRIAALLDGELPRMPLGGQVGPGEVIPLAPLRVAIDRGDFEEGEAMAVSNGSPCAAALAADAAIAARERLQTAVRVLALSIEAFRAPLEAYDQDLAGLWEDAGEVAALAALGEHLAGADPSDRLAHQAPVSYRIIPRVLGQAYRCVEALEHAAQVSLRSASANPVFIPPRSDGSPGRVFSTGGYHNGIAYPAISAMSAAWADLLFVAERHVTALHFGGSSRHLPPMLERPGGRGGRTNLLGWVAGSFLEDARHAASITLLPAGLADVQNDVAVPTFAAYRKYTSASRCLDAGVALLAASASQALWATDREPSPPLRPLLDLIRTIVAPVDLSHGREISEELAHLAEELAATN